MHFLARSMEKQKEKKPSPTHALAIRLPPTISADHHFILVSQRNQDSQRSFMTSHLNIETYANVSARAGPDTNENFRNGK